MNQEKIGKFIAEKRKEKNLTQASLAESLGVSNRSVSNWENGKNMPDLSLFEPLCKELEISINELMSGEMISEEQYTQKLEENLTSTIDYSNKKIKSVKNKFIIIFAPILAVILIVAVMMATDFSKMRKGKPVVFSTWGLKYSPEINLSEDLISIAIDDYLVGLAESEENHYKNERAFVSKRIYLLDASGKPDFIVYAWVLSKKLYYENGKVKEDAAYSLPIMFKVKETDGNFLVTDSRSPRDGPLYEEDIKNIFPYSVRKDMKKVHDDGTIEKLELEIKGKADLYFHR